MRQKKLRIVFVALLICFIGFVPKSAPAGSGWKRVIVRCAPEDLDEVKRILGAAVVDSAHGHYLLNVNSGVDTNRVSSIRGRTALVITAEDDEELSLGPTNVTRTSSYAPPNSLGPISNYFGNPAPQMYSGQFAVGQIHLKDALKDATGAGVRVAVIDTGIDYSHPLFRGLIRAGRNYVGRTSIPSETDDPVIAQSAEDWILTQSSEDWLLTQSSEDWVLTQSAEDWLLTNVGSKMLRLLAKAPSFGHGTATAGLVHLVAPRAEIIPLKAFDARGFATEWNIVRAINDAVDMGADVINMSFAGGKTSKLIADVIKNAAAKGVILVGASGNDGEERTAYPASYADVVGVTSVSSRDTKSTFANYGKYVDISAPGEHLITAYPGGFASLNGTSEAAPLVAGVFALAKDSGVRWSKLRKTVEAGVDRIEEGIYKNKLGSGRINAAKAVKD